MDDWLQPLRACTPRGNPYVWIHPGKNLMVMSGLGVFGLKCLVGLRRI